MVVLPRDRGRGADALDARVRRGPLDGGVVIAFAVSVSISQPHRLLRQQTDSLHAATERAFAAFDLGTRGGYGAFLSAQARAVLPLEDWLEHKGIATLLSDWPARRRGPLLIDDLATLGIAPPMLTGSPAAIVGSALGVAYVLEGSRHGARILVRTPAASQDAAVAAATRFLGQAGGAEAWRALLALIDREGADAEGQAGIARGAASAFDLFHQSAVHVASRMVGTVAHA